MKFKLISLLILFSISFVSFAQDMEQKALDYLVLNIDSLAINYKTDTVLFDSEKNKIWYEPEVDTFDGSKKKVKLRSFGAGNIEQFYKLVHDAKDIHITTRSAKKEGDGMMVEFIIKSNTFTQTNYKVIIDANGNPVSFIKVK